MSLRETLMWCYSEVQPFSRNTYDRAIETLRRIQNYDLIEMWDWQMEPMFVSIQKMIEAQLLAPLILMILIVGLIHLVGRRKTPEPEAPPERISTCRQEETTLIATAINLAKTAYEDGHASKLMSILEAHPTIDVNKLYGRAGLSIFLSGCLSGERDIVSYLLHRGGNVKVKSKEGDSALYLATYGVLSSKTPDTRLLDRLVQAGGDVNAQNQRGYTPLHRAANKGDTEIIKALLQLGADPYLTNASGIYPLDSAINAGHIEAAHLLKIELDDPHVWDVVEPHTPPSVRLGLLSPLKKHLMESTIPTCKRTKKEVFQAEL